MEGSEECDNGDANHNRIGNCTRMCTLPRCGDGIIHRCDTNCNNCGACVDEFCDDGNTIDGDGCSSLCRYENFFDGRLLGDCRGDGIQEVSIRQTLPGPSSRDAEETLLEELLSCETLRCQSPSIDVLRGDSTVFATWLRRSCVCLYIM